MAAFNDAGSSRKRVATYGKAVRKRPPEHVAFKTFADFEKSPAAWKSPSIVSTAVHKVTSNKSQPYSSMTSVDEEMFSVVTSGDESSSTPLKRRKVTRDSHGVGESLRNDHLGANHIPLRNTVGKAEIKSPNVLASIQGAPSSQGCNHQVQSKQVEMARFQSEPGIVAKPIKISSGGGLRLGTRSSEGGTESMTTHRATHTIPREIESPAFQDRHLTPNSDSRLENVTHSPSVSKSSGGVLSPNGMKIWKELLGEEKDNGLEIAGSGGPSQNTNHQERYQRQLNKKHKLPRRRLIDTLAEQSKKARAELGLGSSAEDIEPIESILPSTSQFPESLNTHVKISGNNMDIPQVANTVVVSLGGGQNPQIPGAKITYSRQRSMLAEQDLGKDATFEIPLHDSTSAAKSYNRRGSISVLAPIQSLDEVDEVRDENLGVAIRTIHELRQAGAESRFKDEVEDLLDRIGSPAQHVPVRRLALVNLAQRMNDKTFYARFLTHGIDQRLFLQLGQENDTISGFVMVTLLISVLEAGTTPVAVSHLHQQGITRLLLRLIGISASIITISKHRINNMSKSAQAMLLEQHQNFLERRIWDGIRPQSISPRTASLRCLELLVRQSREVRYTGDVISKELIAKLFEMLKLFDSDKSITTDWVDFQLISSTLELHTLSPTDFDEYLPITKHLLEVTLRASSMNLARAPLLRLVLNATDNSSIACDEFASSEVLHLLCYAVKRNFRVLSGFVIESERHTLVDDLVLMLIVLINIAELSDRARQCFYSPEDSSIDDLTLVFLENNEKSLEADSVEESHLNVAGGYLAVFLGFLSLSPVIRDRIVMQQKARTLQPLITCIDEFISHHKRVDDLLQDEGDEKPQSCLTDRLQRLVDKLKQTREK